MITLELLQEQSDLISKLVATHGFSSPRVFGSVADGSNTADSDVDLLVEPLPGASLLGLSNLEAALSETFGVRFDVNVPGMLRRSWRQRVIEESVPLVVNLNR